MVRLIFGGNPRKSTWWYPSGRRQLDEDEIHNGSALAQVAVRDTLLENGPEDLVSDRELHIHRKGHRTFRERREAERPHLPQGPVPSGVVFSLVAGAHTQRRS